MKTLITSGYNTVTESAIADMEKAAVNITPENVSLINEGFFSKASYPDDERIEFSEASNINGYDVLKINSMIRFLKTKKTEIVIVRKIASVSKKDTEITIQCPEGFSGRLAFVTCKGVNLNLVSPSDFYKHSKDIVIQNESDIKIVLQNYFLSYRYIFVVFMRFK